MRSLLANGLRPSLAVAPSTTPQRPAKRCGRHAAAGRRNARDHARRYRTVNAAGQSLLDSRMLNGVLIMVLVTAILGPVLTQRFAPRLVAELSGDVISVNADT